MQRKVLLACFLVCSLFLFILIVFQTSKNRAETDANPIYINLPQPRYTSDVSIEEAIQNRRSIRDYKDEALTLSVLSQILWSAGGITDKRRGLRAAPSAGATYPLEIYVAAGNVKDLNRGIYKYVSLGHKLIKVIDGDKRQELCKACLGQSWVRKGAFVLIFTAIYERTTKRYGERGMRYVHIEVGHSSENVYLQAVSLNLGTVAIGAFYDEEIKKILKLPDNEEPLYLMPVGRLK
ncbi:MAG: SagB/ThcOx family dehydrogenase [Candidatus Hydrogenedentota bacterium]